LHGPPWTDGGVDRRHRSAAARSPEHGLRALWSIEARRRGTIERGLHGELGSGLTGARAAAWRPGDSGETAEQRKLSNNSARALKEGKSEMGEVW
jgi:hypothetical protein